MIVALPVLLIEHTGIRDKRETVECELCRKAHAVNSSTSVHSTSTDTNTTSPVTVASSSASRPFRPVRNVAVHATVTVGSLRARAKRCARHELTVVVDVSQL